MVGDISASFGETVIVKGASGSFGESIAPVCGREVRVISCVGGTAATGRMLSGTAAVGVRRGGAEGFLVRGKGGEAAGEGLGACSLGSR